VVTTYLMALMVWPQASDGGHSVSGGVWISWISLCLMSSVQGEARGMDHACHSRWPWQHHVC
jgi:hypothetical protein